MKVSVVVPIYGVENFIARCAESLLSQTLNDVEYIFVDDASPDNSIAILSGVIERYPNRKNNVQIITHPTNKGLPAARNTGMSAATGEYIYHCDSDDFAEPDMLEKMYSAALRENADYVWCDWFLSYENNEREMKQPAYRSADEAMRGMMRGEMKYNVWNKLIKRSLYVKNGIQFPAGYSMGEDMTMIRVAACATGVAHVAKPLYHYVKSNSEAMTQHYSDRHLADVCHNLDETIAFVAARKHDVENVSAFFKLNLKLPFLISDSWDSYRLWNRLYPEANSYIDRNRSFSFRTRLLQKMAMRKLYPLLWIYYIVVYRFLYTVLYK